jgi:hypothetical protein
MVGTLAVQHEVQVDFGASLAEWVNSEDEPNKSLQL